METGERTIRITPTQLEYLKRSCFLDISLNQVIQRIQTKGGKISFRIPHSTAEEFRNAVTERLAEVGFDLNYELTNEGKILEELIDCFFSNESEKK